MKAPKTIMACVVREGEEVLAPTFEVMADEFNKFSENTEIISYSAGDLDVYIVLVYGGLYYPRRKYALESIGYTDIMKFTLKDLQERLAENAYVVYNKHGKEIKGRYSFEED